MHGFRVRATPGPYPNSSWPGSSPQACTTLARREPASRTRCSLPAFARTRTEFIRAFDLHVFAAQHGKAERLILSGVLLVADPDQCFGYQPDYGGERPLPRQVWAVEIVVDVPAETGKLPPEVAHPAEFLVAEGGRRYQPRGPAHAAPRGGRHLSADKDLESLQGPALRTVGQSAVGLGRAMQLGNLLVAWTIPPTMTERWPRLPPSFLPHRPLP